MSWQTFLQPPVIFVFLPSTRSPFAKQGTKVQLLLSHTETAWMFQLAGNKRFRKVLAQLLQLPKHWVCAYLQYN